MSDPCARCPTPDCYMTECKNYMDRVAEEETKAKERRLRQFEIESKEGFCANFDELCVQCIKQYKTDYKQTNELMIQGITYAFDFLKNNETRSNT